MSKNIYRINVENLSNGFCLYMHIYIYFYVYEISSKVKKKTFWVSRKILISSSISILLPSNPYDTIYLCQSFFFQFSRHFWYVIFALAFSSLSLAVFISLIVAKLRPFMGLFSLGNREKWQWATTGVYGG